jgi:hypothetical protein
MQSGYLQAYLIFICKNSMPTLNQFIKKRDRKKNLWVFPSIPNKAANANLRQFAHDKSFRRKIYLWIFGASKMDAYLPVL